MFIVVDRSVRLLQQYTHFKKIKCNIYVYVSYNLYFLSILYFYNLFIVKYVTHTSTYISDDCISGIQSIAWSMYCNLVSLSYTHKTIQYFPMQDFEIATKPADS